MTEMFTVASTPVVPASLDARASTEKACSLIEEADRAGMSMATIRGTKALCDTAGHHSRLDVLQLHVNRRPRRRIVEAG